MIIIMVLAVFGSFLSIHPPTTMMCRFIYLVVFIILGVVAVYLNHRLSNQNYKKRMDADSQLKESFIELNNSLAETARLQKLTSDQQEKLLEQSKDTINLQKKSINTTSGGNSFCYMVFLSPIEDGVGLPVFITVGEYPLYGVRARIVDLEKHKKLGAKDILGLSEILANDVIINIGDMPVNSTNLSEKVLTYTNSANLEYNIFYNARNGLWNQLLRIKNINGKSVRAIQVKRVEGVESIAVFEEIDDGFPRNQNGNIDWNEY